MNAITGQNLIGAAAVDRKSTRLNSSHRCISYAVFCLKKKSAERVDAQVVRVDLDLEFLIHHRVDEDGRKGGVASRLLFFFLKMRRPPKPPLFPYPTLFR